MKKDDEKQFQTYVGVDQAHSLDGELKALRSRLRWAHESQGLAAGVLTLLNREVVGLDAIREILRMVKEFTGLEAVGIRLREGEDFPYLKPRAFRIISWKLRILCAVALTVARSSGIPLEIRSWSACAATYYKDARTLHSPFSRKVGVSGAIAQQSFSPPHRKKIDRLVPKPMQPGGIRISCAHTVAVGP